MARRVQHRTNGAPTLSTASKVGMDSTGRVAACTPAETDIPGMAFVVAGTWEAGSTSGHTMVVVDTWAVSCTSRAVALQLVGSKLSEVNKSRLGKKL
jgi:hypothetical protein